MTVQIEIVMLYGYLDLAHKMALTMAKAAM